MVKYDGPKRGNKVKNGKLGKLVDDNEDKKVFEYNDIGFRYPTQVWRFKRDVLTSNIHPTQKPIALYEELIKTYSNPCDLILDNCSGSGTIAIAALNTGRHFIGFETDENYYNESIKRIENYGNQQTTF
jgi:site-specific DNA-methyltransferase (adenine-specific)